MVDAPPPEKRPDSQDPKVYFEPDPNDTEKDVGGWNVPMEKDPDFNTVVEVWRAQKPRAFYKETKIMDRISVSSSNISSVGYEDESHTLEIEFHHGGTYQYYEVPKHVYEELISASSVGQYFAQNIKNIYRYSRI